MHFIRQTMGWPPSTPCLRHHQGKLWFVTHESEHEAWAWQWFADKLKRRMRNAIAFLIHIFYVNSCAQCAERVAFIYSLFRKINYNCVHITSSVFSSKLFSDRSMLFFFFCDVPFLSGECLRSFTAQTSNCQTNKKSKCKHIYCGLDHKI